MQKGKNDFLQPIISTLGLGVSVFSSLLPFMSDSFISTLLLDKNYINIASMLAFIIGIIVVWVFVELKPYPQLPLGKMKDRGKGYPEYWKIIKPVGFIGVLVFLCSSLAFIFILFDALEAESKVMALLQAVIYFLFFLGLVSIFGLLFSQTKSKYVFDSERELFPVILLNTLQNYGVVAKDFEVVGVRLLTDNDVKKHNLVHFALNYAKFVTVKFGGTEKRCIVSGDGRELIKVVEK